MKPTTATAAVRAVREPARTASDTAAAVPATAASTAGSAREYVSLHLMWLVFWWACTADVVGLASGADETLGWGCCGRRTPATARFSSDRPTVSERGRTAVATESVTFGDAFGALER